MRDIVIPNGNETELATAAEKLGYNHITFLYPNAAALNEASARIPSLPITHNALVSNIAKKQPAPSCIEATIATVRKLAEHTKPTMIYGVEANAPKDYVHQRGSGINHIIARFMHENNIAYAFSTAPLLGMEPARRATILGRIKQNIELFNKYKVTMLIASFAHTQNELRSPSDTQSLFRLLGMSPQILNSALELTSQEK